jgi:glycosyltransferase involved in cell wall biosynthesis
MNDPKISVVMPVWNGERYLREAVESILNQTFHDFEFIILDDGSTDRTPEILAEFAARDSRVRVIRLAHEGIVIALNRGVAEANAQWIARMDADDIARPERLARQWEALRKNPEAVLCHTHIHIIGDRKYVTPAGRFIRTKALLALRLCFQCPIVHPTVIFSKAAFIECGGYVPEERHAEDYGLWGRLLMTGEVIGCAEPLLDFRVHADSISKIKSDTQQRLAEQIAKRHCQKFGNFTTDEAETIYQILVNGSRRHGAKNWLVFMLRYAPRFRWHTIELWAWLFSRLIKLTLSR